MRSSRILLVLPACLVLVVAAAAPGVAGPAGIKGEPQPEIASFVVAPATTIGVVDATMMPDGSVASAYISGDDTVAYCVIQRGKHACSVSTTITAPDAQSIFGTPQVIVLSDTDVDVVVDEAEQDALYQSTDGGASFGPPVDLGSTVSVGTSEVVAGDLVFSQADTSTDSDQVESVSLSAPSAPAQVAEVFDNGDSQDFNSAGLGSYDGGVLVGATNFTQADKVQTAFAPAGTDFDATASYGDPATLTNETALGMSGSALLTEQTTGKEAVRLRVWTGSSWTAPAVVPDYQNSGPEVWSVFQEPSGRVYVISSLTGHGYALYVTSTTDDGQTWSTPRHLENATTSFGFGVALDGQGTGLLTSSDEHHVHAYPVMGATSVSIHLAHPAVKVHRFDKVSGSVSPATSGATVDLQEERHGLWYDIAHTQQSSSGAYVFKVTQPAPVTLKLRVMAQDKPGYLEYGYSSAKSMTFTALHH